MRFDGDYDEDFPGQWGLWEGARKQAFSSKRGQDNLRRLRDALLALPDKKLISTRLVDVTGGVCAMGALAVQSKVDEGMKREEAVALLVADLDPDDDPEWVDTHEEEQRTLDWGAHLGMTRVMAVDIGWHNDLHYKATDEERYEQVMQWLNTVILDEVPA